jgi:hypothetical protein
MQKSIPGYIREAQGTAREKFSLNGDKKITNSFLLAIALENRSFDFIPLGSPLLPNHPDKSNSRRKTDLGQSTALGEKMGLI